MAEVFKTLDQTRAEFVWECLWKCLPEGRVNDDLVRHAKSAPAMVANNGLMQALAFWQSKPDAWGSVSNVVCLWLAKQGLVQDHEQALRELAKLSSDRYRRATEEALEILKWLRQLAAAVKGAEE